jgi:hypothetical protein
LDYGVKITLSKQISKELLYPIKLIFILLCADWSAWEFQEELTTALDNVWKVKSWLSQLRRCRYAFPTQDLLEQKINCGDYL